MSWPPKAAATTRSAKVKFATYTADGKLDTEHATCTVRFTTDAQQKSIQKKISDYKAAIAELRARDAKGELVHYNTKSGYKLMSSMAHFHPDYKLLNTLVLDQAENEAVSLMNFTNCQDGGTYAAHPAYVDAITQVAGFAMNAKDDTDIDKEVYVNHGWESFQIYEPLRKDTAYEVHTKMIKDKSGDLVHGDTIVLDGEKIVAFFKGQSLRSVPRKALRAVLQSAMDKGIRQRGGKPSNAKTSTASAAQHSTPAASVKTAEKTTSTVIPKSPTQKAAPKTSNSSNNQFREALNIISEESGIAPEELPDDSNFVEIGVDSLSSMVITSRLREDLGLDLDPAFALFADCPTVLSLKEFLGGSGDTSSDEDTTSIEPLKTAIEDYSEVDAIVDAVMVENDASLSESTHQTPNSSRPANNDANFTEALKIVAEESGVAVEDFTEDTVFADIGIDSLCSMVISSRFREELELDLDSSFSLFNDLPSVSDLSAFFSESSASSDAEASSEDIISNDSSGNTTDTDTSEETPKLNLVPFCRPTNSVVLQGMPKLASKILFMLPDGGGSASSYATIPRLQADVAIVGLNCPYARDPENMNCTHGAMIQCFVNEIQRRQPHGPYHLGGWSSGGAFAYVTAEALVNAGEEVHSLIIIDAPVPQVMEKLPVEFYQHCNGIGLFENQPGGASAAANPPPYLIPHFMTVVDVMLDYKVAPLNTNRMPKVGIVWASETVMKEDNAPKMKGMHFMIQKRTDFGPDGWDKVCPGAEFDIVRAEGANHFTLMTKSKVRLVSDLIDRVMR